MSTTPRIVIVSGGSAGLGGALLAHFLARGDTVAIFSRGLSESLERTLAAHADDDRFVWQSVDASDPAATCAFANAMLRRFRRIDALVNNAGIGTEGLLTLTSDEAIERTIEVDLSSPVALTRVCVKGMLVAHDGSIVNISPVNAIRGHKGAVSLQCDQGSTSRIHAQLGARGRAEGHTRELRRPGVLRKRHGRAPVDGTKGHHRQTFSTAAPRYGRGPRSQRGVPACVDRNHRAGLVVDAGYSC